MFTRLLPMNLQYFAEQAQAGNGEGSNTNASNTQSNNNDGEHEDGNGGDDSDGADKTFSRKDVRGLISSAMDDFKNKSLPGLLEQARKDGESRAKMTEEQRESADQKAHQAELDKREAELNHRESVSATRDLLAKNSLPEDFAEMLTDNDADKRSQHVEDFGKAFNKAVQAGVEERLKGNRNPGQSVNNGSNHDDTEFAQKLAKATHPKKTANDFFGNK